MRTASVLILGVLLAGGDAHAEDGLIVLNPKMDTASREAADPVALGNLAASVIAELDEHHVLTHEDAAAMLGQAKMQALYGCNDDGCIVELSGAMGAPLLFYSNVGVVGGAYVVTANLIDNREARVLERQSISVKASNRLAEAMRVVTLRLLGRHADLAPPADFAVARWTTLGAGLAAVTLGGISTGLAVRAKTDADTAASQADFNSSQDSVKTWNTVAIANYALGGVCLAASIVLFFLEPDKEGVEAGSTSQTAVHVQPLPNGAMIGVQGGF